MTPLTKFSGAATENEVIILRGKKIVSGGSSAVVNSNRF